MVTTLGEVSPQFLSASLAESVEKLLRALLHDRDFQLDGDDMRRYLVFRNVAFDRDPGQEVPLSPEIRSSHSTGWSLGRALGSEQHAQLMTAITLANQAIVSDEATAALEA